MLSEKRFLALCRKNEESARPKIEPPVQSSDLLWAGWRFTQHSIERFRNRARGMGCKQSYDTLRNKMAAMLQNRKPLGGSRFYTSSPRCGLVWIIEGTLVITVMRPTEERLQRKIWKAHNNDYTAGIH